MNKKLDIDYRWIERVGKGKGDPGGVKKGRYKVRETAEELAEDVAFLVRYTRITAIVWVDKMGGVDRKVYLPRQQWWTEAFDDTIRYLSQDGLKRAIMRVSTDYTKAESAHPEQHVSQYSPTGLSEIRFEGVFEPASS